MEKDVYVDDGSKLIVEGKGKDGVFEDPTVNGVRQGWEKESSRIYQEQGRLAGANDLLSQSIEELKGRTASWWKIFTHIANAYNRWTQIPKAQGTIDANNRKVRSLNGDLTELADKGAAALAAAWVEEHEDAAARRQEILASLAQAREGKEKFAEAVSKTDGVLRVIDNAYEECDEAEEMERRDARASTAPPAPPVVNRPPVAGGGFSAGGVRPASSGGGRTADGRRRVLVKREVVRGGVSSSTGVSPGIQGIPGAGAQSADSAEAVRRRSEQETREAVEALRETGTALKAYEGYLRARFGKAADFGFSGGEALDNGGGVGGLLNSLSGFANAYASTENAEKLREVMNELSRVKGEIAAIREDFTLALKGEQKKESRLEGELSAFHRDILREARTPETEDLFAALEKHMTPGDPFAKRGKAGGTKPGL